MRVEVSKRLILVTKNENNTQKITVDFITLFKKKKVIAYVLPTSKAFVTHF